MLMPAGTAAQATLHHALVDMPLAPLPACSKAQSPPEWGSPRCLQSQVEAVDAARSSEGLGPMSLPPSFAALTLPEQVLVVTDLERSARGLPLFGGLSSSLDAMSFAGATSGNDPVGPPNVTWGSNWAGGYESAVLADYSWMYDDGPGSPNVGCPHAGAPGCWLHRQNILGNYGSHPVMGAAAVTWHGTLSLAAIFASSAPGWLVWRAPGWLYANRRSRPA